MVKKPAKNSGEMPTTEELLHQQTILVEGLRSDFKFVIEKVDGMEGSLRSQMTQDKAELKQEIADTRDALTLRIDNVQLELKREIQGVKTELKQEIMGVENRLSGKIDRFGEKIEKHDHEIKEIRLDLATH